MAFFVEHKKLAVMSGRARSTWSDYRKLKKFPFKTLKDEKGENYFVSDVDNPKIRKLIMEPPRNMTGAMRKRRETTLAAFQRGRDDGSEVCALTGEADAKAEWEQRDAKSDLSGALSRMDDDSLDRRKKELEVEKLARTTEKLEVAIKAATGDTVARSFVESWIQRYVGNMHQQILDLGDSGMADDVYTIAMRLKDESPQVVVKEIQKALGRGLSQIIKDSVETMRRNSL